MYDFRPDNNLEQMMSQILVICEEPLARRYTYTQLEMNCKNSV